MILKTLADRQSALFPVVCKLATNQFAWIGLFVSSIAPAVPCGDWILESSVSWTGYKTSAKIPAKGVFHKLTWSLPGTTDSSIQQLDQLIKKSKLQIDAQSADANDPAKNTNLLGEFFSLWIQKQIEVRPIAFQKNGPGTIELTLNGVRANIPVRWSSQRASKGKVTIGVTGEIDLLSFQLSEPLARLAKACAPMHTGDDGVSKTWPVATFEGTFALRDPSSKCTR